MNAVELLTGVGQLYIAPVGTTFPLLTATPSSPWVSFGETQDGVKVATSIKFEELRVDQRSGPVKAVPTEEDLTIETKLALATLENQGYALGVTVTDTPPAAGVIGTRAISLHRGASATEYALLFRGSQMSPYGATYPAQYEVPRGYISAVGAFEHKRNANVQVAITFKALESLTALAGEEFGRLIVQDAAALEA